MGRGLKRVLLASLLSLLTIWGSLAYAAGIGDPDDLEAFLDGIFAIQREQYRVPGISVAVIENGEIMLSKGYGWADLAGNVAFDPQTSLHRAGSNSKLLVSMAILQLWEQGKLDLHGDINDYLDFTIPATLAQGQKAPPITIHHLLTHTAGFEDKISQLFAGTAQALPGLGGYLRENLPGRVFLPGTVASYSNYGMALAGYIVELASEMPFQDYVAENIFQPLQMASATFEQPLPQELAAGMSKGYVYKKGEYLPGDFEYIQAFPAGALTSSTQDMANLILAFLQLGVWGEERVLKEESSRLMQEQHYTGHPQLGGMAYGFIEDEVNGYRILTHGGDTGLFHTGLYLIPAEGVGLYLTYNSQDAAAARQGAFLQFMHRYFPPKGEDSSVPRPIAAGTERNYEGLFHSARSNYTSWESIVRFFQTTKVTVDEDGYLVLDPNNNPLRFGEIEAGLLQELTDPNKKIALFFEDGRLTKIHFPGPHTLLRTPWYHSLLFLGPLLFGAILLMIAVLIGWIRRLFHKNRRGRPFALPKILGLLFIITFFTLAILSLDLLLDTHPDLGIPQIFLKPISTLNPVFLLAKFLVGLSSFLLLTAIYSWFKKRGTLWQRTYYSLLALFACSISWLLWQINLF